MTRSRAFLVLLASAIAVPSGTFAATAIETSAGPAIVEIIATDLENPWGLAFLPNGDLLVSERTGNLRIVSDGIVGSPIDNVPDVYASGQGGLLDVALDPDFASNLRIFLSYSEPGPGGAGTAIASGVLKADGTKGRLEDVTVLFRQNIFSGGGRHFGSRLAFAPDDTLFFSIGDRGDGPRAQDADDHAGSILRISKDGSVPEDNPFAAGEGAAEIWSIGHRNAQGMAIRPSDGTLWTVEHGARGGDEVNRPNAGLNFGWPEISYGRQYSGGKIGRGTEAPGLEQPEYYWDPSIAPSGLAFYQGDLFPEWQGDLFVGALKDQMLVRLEMDGDEFVGEERLLEGDYGRIRDVRAGPDGAIWMLTDEIDGQILRLSPAP